PAWNRRPRRPDEALRRGHMSNAEIARQLDRLADLSELDGDNPFKVRAYRNAAATVRDIEKPVEELLKAGADLTTIKGIGKEIAAKVRTLVETGVLPQLAELEERVPVEIGRASCRERESVAGL